MRPAPPGWCPAPGRAAWRAPRPRRAPPARPGPPRARAGCVCSTSAQSSARTFGRAPPGGRGALRRAGGRPWPRARLPCPSSGSCPPPPRPPGPPRRARPHTGRSARRLPHRKWPRGSTPQGQTTGAARPRAPRGSRPGRCPTGCGCPCQRCPGPRPSPPAPPAGPRSGCHQPLSRGQTPRGGPRQIGTRSRPGEPRGPRGARWGRWASVPRPQRARAPARPA
mmetsp:Transcript_15551/g.52504  ORF Transcript_15551/g.52504 Transcript_15551/m.52504 type:complete len:223 (+) Transcript_15551:369-1037(+)